MSADIQPAGSSLSEILSRSDYTYFLARHVQQVGVRVGTATFLFRLDAESGDVALRVCDKPDQAKPDFWVECELRDVQKAAQREVSVESLSISTGSAGQVLHPRVETILLRCFQVPPYPLEDREELVYGSLFGFDTPEVLWQTSRNLVRTLRYPANAPGSSYCVSSGLSQPGIMPPAEIYEEGIAGAGYELVLRSADPALVEQFSSWVQYVVRTQSHLLPGNWLEYPDGQLVPGTDIAGFLVVEPMSFKPEFPVGPSMAFWHQLVPATATQLKRAKRTDVFQVAERIEQESGG